MNAEFVPADQTHRDRIALSLDETLFVEAGAGTGKTAALVSRIVQLIGTGRAAIDQIAAITFTDAAAAELRERVRRGLEERGALPDAKQDERARCIEAVAHLDSASIQTLHGFAASLLRDSPLEAGLPPGFETVEEIGADLDFERRWREWLDETLDSEDSAPSIAQGLRYGLHLDRLRDIALQFHGNYDLLDAPIRDEPLESTSDPSDIVETRERIRELLPLASNGQEDPLVYHATRVAVLCDRLASVAGGPDAAAMLVRFGKLSTTRGAQKDWETDPGSGINGCKLLKDLLKDAEAMRVELVEAAYRSAATGVLEELRRFVLDYSERRRIAGKAEFHDLLIWARDLLRDDPTVRDQFRSRFKAILIDEFQDTDPIQAEIAFLLAGEPGQPAQSWTQVEVLPGKLFVVGDPKQSIYRFRRADIAALGSVKELLGEGVVPLSQNFRCQSPIIDWVNEVFASWVGDEPSLLQAPYLSLDARWTPPDADPPLGVHWLGGQTTGGAESVREEEAESVASLLRQIKESEWKVRAESGDGLRSAEYRDVCILMPRRTALRSLEQALDDAGVPYRVESQSAVLQSQDVRELLDCLRAIDAPADQIALVAALRSSAFGCSDLELLEFVESGGRFSYIEPGAADGPVKDSLEVLARFHRRRAWEPPDQLIEQFIRQRRMIEAGFDRRRPRERWRRLRLIVDRARAFAQVGGGTLRAFLDWIERQAEGGARIVEVPVPETDEDAVRIMTVHAAKGLEFPIVVLMGLGASRRQRYNSVIFDRTTGRVEARMSSGNDLPFQTQGYAEAAENEQLAEQAEEVRLMYVASTRARDHLAVSLFHPQRASNSLAARIAGLGAEAPHLWNAVELVPPAIEARSTALAETVSMSDKADRDAWIERRAEVLKSGSAPAAVAATRIAQVDDKEEVPEEPSYRRGRGGTSVGRAVHAVLQIVDLETGEDLEQISRAQADAEGIPGEAPNVERFARQGIESEIVQRAVASGRYYKELFVAAPVGGRVLEGFVDLAFEEDGHLVIVDYKTDAVRDPQDLELAKDRYGVQLGAYALALQQSAGIPVKQATLLFLNTREPAGRPVDVDDIEALAAEAERRVQAYSPA